MPPEDIPWEVINLDGALLQNVAVPAQPTFDYVTTVTVTDGPADLDISLMLPEGFAVADGQNADPATWCPKGTTCAQHDRTEPTARARQSDVPHHGVPSGEYDLRIPVRAGLTVGPASQFPTSVSVTATGPNSTQPILATAGPVGVAVVEAVAGGPGRAPLLQDSQLQLGHIGSSNDVDVYSFQVPDGTTGASARILLSNIPAGVDYDLSVYGPEPESLRGTPEQTLNSLGDVSFDLDPSDDVLSTDLANDIAIDINKLAETIPELADKGELRAPRHLQPTLQQRRGGHASRARRRHDLRHHRVRLLRRPQPRAVRPPRPPRHPHRAPCVCNQSDVYPAPVASVRQHSELR